MSKKKNNNYPEEDLKNTELKNISESQDVKQEKIKKLKELMPEIFTESDKIDTDKLKKTLGEFVNEENERYVLNWAGKSEAFKVLQTQTTATLAPDKEESINFDTTENIFIEGENLEVLKVLQKSYHNKIKMIYIDPPYNTGNDSFIYPDKFEESKSDYLKRIGEKDEEGFLLKEGLFRKNSKENGQYHSNWLSMIYPRLFLARNLLRDDGVIFVSIDDNEVHNLRMVMNEIFGEENFLASIIWEKKFSPQNDAKYLSDNHDYIIIFAKNKDIWRPTLLSRTEKEDARYKNLDNDPRGAWSSSDLSVKTYSKDYDYPIKTPSGKIIMPTKGRCWRTSKANFEKLVTEKRIWFGENGDNVPRLKRFLNEVQDGIVPLTIWRHMEVGHNQEARQELKNLFNDNAPFDTPKPVRLLNKILRISTQSEDNNIILDFFAGSGTTAQAVLELNKKDYGNRKFILTQLPEKTAEDSEAYKAGYKTIADICKERIRRVIKNLETETKNEQIEMGKEAEKNLDLGFKVFKLKNSNFKLWRGDVIENGEDLTKQLEVFDDPIKKGTEDENIVYELMLKMGLDLNMKVEKCGMSIGINKKDNSKKDDKLLYGNFTYYKIDNGKLIIFTESKGQTGNFIKELMKEVKPEKIICLDRIFDGDDETKTNLVLQMRDAGVEFKTV